MIGTELHTVTLPVMLRSCELLCAVRVDFLSTNPAGLGSIDSIRRLVIKEFCVNTIRIKERKPKRANAVFKDKVQIFSPSVGIQAQPVRSSSLSPADRLSRKGTILDSSADCFYFKQLPANLPAMQPMLPSIRATLPTSASLTTKKDNQNSLVAPPGAAG